MRSGQLIAGRYRLDEQIGSGAVWRAIDQELDRVVAMRRTHQAAKAQIGFRHPNIVTVFDVVTDGDDRWLVLEYVPSRNLTKILADKGTLPPAQIARLGEQIASALAALHEKGLVYGDVLPAKVLVTTSGDAKLTPPDPVLGTTAADDMFSLGVTLYVAVPIRSAINTLLDTMVDRKPSRRPSADVARQRLHELVADRGVPPIPEVNTNSAQSLTAYRRIVLVGAAMLALVVVGVGFLVLRPSPPAAVERPPAVIGDPRTADPCALMDQQTLGRFGRAVLDPNYGNFDRCDVLIQAGGGQIDAEVQFVGPAAKTAGPTHQEGEVGVIPGTASNGQCRWTIVLADQNSIVVSATLKSGSSTADYCAIADSATNTAVDVINKDGIPRRTTNPDPRSLALVDACALLNAKALSVVPGIQESQAGFGDWSCRWIGNATVDVQFDRGAPLTAASGTPIQVGSRPAFQAQDTCVVAIEYRRYTGQNDTPLAEIVRLTVTGNQPHSQLCDTATTLAGSVETSLPPA
ncbi:MAG TPA: protein kinase [Pseudonocardiaceae bacterium]|nr:protein kinase [Pseudonocardiaceae bacterium]